MKKLISCLSAIMLIFSLCSCSGSTNSTAPTSQETNPLVFDISEYKADVSAYRDLTYQSSIILANVGNYENNYWKTLGRLSDDMSDRAFEWLAENSEETQETVSASYEAIQSAYGDLTSADIDEEAEAAEIAAGVDALHVGYSALYELVTKPSGSREDFVQALSDLINDVEAANDTLSNLLSEDE